MSPRLWVVLPCFFDVPSFLQVRERAIAALKGHRVTELFPEIRFILLDDSAGQDRQLKDVQSLSDVEILQLPYNMGHQGALVYGLRTLGTRVQETDLVITLDSDGEDRPSDIPAVVEPLISPAEIENLHLISLAKRTSRTESLPFKIFYACFKTIFKTATGTIIQNGNFAAFRGWFLKEVIFHPHFDQCYSSSFISLPIVIRFVPLPRGHRFFGRSKMGYLGLINHGFRMLMPFSDKIAIRGMIFSGMLFGLGLAWTAALGVCALVCDEVSRASFYFPAFLVLYSSLLATVFALLFVTFSQTKSHSLRATSKAS